MLCVLVVDDEEWIRLGIVSKLKKSRFDFREILQAQSAEQALETALERRPDIVLCDIRMDGMDGLVFSRRLLESLPDTRIVIISGYNDFAYAKEAIRLGVVDYLLKPIDADSLNQALERCIRQLAEKHQNRCAIAAVKKARQRKALRSVAAELLEQAEPDYGRLFGAYTGGGLFQAVDFYLDISCSLSADTLDEHIGKLFHGLVLGENLIYYENRRNEFLIVLYTPPGGTGYEPDAFVRTLESSLCTEISSISPHQYTFGISGPSPDFGEAVHEAVCCMKHRVLCAGKSRIHPDDISPFSSGKIDGTFLSDLKEVLCRRDLEHLEPVLKSMYASIESASVSYESLQSLYLRVLILLREHVSLPSARPLQMPPEIYYFSSVWDWIDFLKELLTRFFEEDQPLSGGADPRLELVEQVQSYIRENFAKKLSLSEIAQQQHINYCYLSLLFKDVAKVTFQDYLMDVRLNHACQLLQTGKYKVKDVAELSGFFDQHYFSKTFKKATGYTPREYQVAKQNETEN